MKKTLGKLIALFLCLAFVLCGCQQSDQNQEETTKKPKKTTESVATTEAPEQVEKPANLTPVIIDENEIVSRLNGNKGIEVKIDDKQTIVLDYHGWPTVCRGEGNTLYASASLRISHIDPFGAVVFYESQDNGVTWSEPKIIADTVLDDRDSGVVYLGNGKLVVNWFCHNADNYVSGDYTAWQKIVTTAQKNAKLQNFKDADDIDLLGGSFIVTSDDYGKTWSDPIRVPVKSPHGPTLGIGKDAGTLFFFGVPSANHTLIPGISKLEYGYAYLFASRDGGKTWTQRSKVKLPTNLGKDTFYDECYTIQLQDGSFLGAIRTEKSDFGHWTICITRSKDGYQWSDPIPLTGPDGSVQNGAPPHFLQLKNGVILLAYSHRNSDQCGSRGRVSYDNGVTWSDEFIICVSDQPKNGDLGYPSTVELDDGTLLTTYYQAYGTDKFPSLLYTRWRLESVVEGNQ